MREKTDFNGLEALYQKNVLTITMGLSEVSTNYSRAIYNSLDFLGDVGGLLEALKLIVGTFVALVNPSSLYSELTARLFYRTVTKKSGAT